MEKRKIEDESYLWNIVSIIIFIILIIILIILTAAFDRARIPNTFQFVIMGIATFRLIHLFLSDMVMDFMRDYFNQFDSGPQNTIRKLLSCPWCIGIWMALFIGYLYYLIPYSLIFIIILAIAGLGTIIEITVGLIQKS